MKQLLGRRVLDYRFILKGDVSIAATHFMAHQQHCHKKVYEFSTSISVNVPIVLEELGLQYELHAVNVTTCKRNSLRCNQPHSDWGVCRMWQLHTAWRHLAECTPHESNSCGHSTNQKSDLTVNMTLRVSPNTL